MEYSLPQSLAQMFFLVFKASGPLLGVAAVAGLVTAIFQGATQIQDQTLPSVAKIVAVLAMMLAFGPMLFAPLARFAVNSFELIPMIAR